MNIKSLLTLATLTAAGTAAAAVYSNNTLCRIEINSAAKSTIVAVPLAKVGTGDPTKVGTGDPIPVTELVLTDNLENGDTLLHWNKTDENWEAWSVNGSAWKPLTITQGMDTTWTKGADTATLARGDAIWVNRSNTSKSFYIYGQVATGGETTVVPPTDPATVAYTMMAAPTTDKDGFQLNTLVGKKTTGSFADGDMIVVSNPSDSKFGRMEYTFKSEKENFCSLEATRDDQDKVTGIAWKVVNATVPVGEGFWYVSKGGDPTIKW